ncbi:hypothetical protein [Kitasatospora sp. LaBMicrA B282]|uniref:hypothetical protein n=1 Tax=Kitasatospora sp. LaBMicrA B282 TaxID=3420949 RepID=UPI003D143821
MAGRRDRRETRSNDLPKSLLGRIGMTLWMTFLAVILTGLGTVGTISLAEDLPYAARLAGAPGTLHIDECITIGSGKHKATSCYGTFRPDGGGAADENAFTNTTHDRGTTLPVQHLADGNCYEVGVLPVAVRLGGMLVALLAAVGGLLILGTAVLSWAPGLSDRLGRSRGADRLGRIAARTAGWMAAAAGLCFLVSLIGWIVTP